jgi:hypothetical protein
MHALYAITRPAPVVEEPKRYRLVPGTSSVVEVVGGEKWGNDQPEGPR